MLTWQYPSVCKDTSKGGTCKIVNGWTFAPDCDNREHQNPEPYLSKMLSAFQKNTVLLISKPILQKTVDNFIMFWISSIKKSVQTCSCYTDFVSWHVTSKISHHLALYGKFSDSCFSRAVLNLGSASEPPNELLEDKDPQAYRNSTKPDFPQGPRDATLRSQLWHQFRSGQTADFIQKWISY